MSYNPRFTSKIMVHNLSNKKVAQKYINIDFLRFGENEVIKTLLEHGVDYTKLPGDDGTVNDWENNTTLKEAATYSVLCLMSKAGVKGAVPLSGPITSVSVDGMSKSFGGAGSLLRKGIKSEFDHCEKANNLIASLIKIWRTAFGSAKKSSPRMSRSNKVFDRNLRRYRRRQYDTQTGGL